MIHSLQHIAFADVGDPVLIILGLFSLKDFHIIWSCNMLIMDLLGEGLSRSVSYVISLKSTF